MEVQKELDRIGRMRGTVDSALLIVVYDGNGKQVRITRNDFDSAFLDRDVCDSMLFDRMRKELAEYLERLERRRKQ